EVAMVYNCAERLFKGLASGRNHLRSHFVGSSAAPARNARNDLNISWRAGRHCDGDIFPGLRVHLGIESLERTRVGIGVTGEIASLVQRVSVASRIAFRGPF